VASAVLTPDEAQRTFRAVLDALAHPGVPQPLPSGPLERVPGALLPVLALADLGTPVCVLGDDGSWRDTVATATSALPAPLPEARLVAALLPVTPDELRAARRGSAAAPEDGALVTVPVSGVDRGGAPLRLTGPGVDGSAVIAPGGLPAGWLAARDAGDFPAGVDLLLVGPDGRVVGLPRSTRIEED
jgi:alpha-D-ribose 1-methylphosphonate 5-triphosphate synthase subunit PhnH